MKLQKTMWSLFPNNLFVQTLMFLYCIQIEFVIFQAVCVCVCLSVHAHRQTDTHTRASPSAIAVAHVKTLSASVAAACLLGSV